MKVSVRHCGDCAEYATRSIDTRYSSTPVIIDHKVITILDDKVTEARVFISIVWRLLVVTLTDTLHNSGDQLYTAMDGWYGTILLHLEYEIVIYAQRVTARTIYGIQ